MFALSCCKKFACFEHYWCGLKPFRAGKRANFSNLYELFERSNQISHPKCTVACTAVFEGLVGEIRGITEDCAAIVHAVDVKLIHGT
jgi:hypothetical protein